MGGLNNRNLFSHSCGGQKSKIKVPADSVSGEDSDCLADGCLLAMSSLSSVSVCEEGRWGRQSANQKTELSGVYSCNDTNSV